MIFVRKIDEQGFFTGDDFVEEITEFTIEALCPQGFYKPKWDFTQKIWVEGLTQIEIDAIISTQNVDPKEVAISEIEKATTIAGLRAAMLKYINI